MNFVEDGSASRSIPFEIEPITSPPSSADHTVPRPPNSDVPAITGPAIASSSRSLPAEESLTASRGGAKRRPAPAARRQARAEEEPSTRGEQPGEHEHRDAPPIHVNPGAPGHLGIAADRQHVATE